MLWRKCTEYRRRFAISGAQLRWIRSKCTLKVKQKNKNWNWNELICQLRHWAVRGVHLWTRRNQCTNGSQAFGVHLHEATERNPEEIAENASETPKVPVDCELPQRRVVEVSRHAKPSGFTRSQRNILYTGTCKHCPPHNSSSQLGSMDTDQRRISQRPSHVAALRNNPQWMAWEAECSTQQSQAVVRCWRPTDLARQHRLQRSAIAVPLSLWKELMDVIHATHIWSFLTFLHHGIEKVEGHLVWKLHKKMQRKNWSNMPPKLLACKGFLYKVVHKIGRLQKFRSNRSHEIEFYFLIAWTISKKFGTLVQHAPGYRPLPQIF